MHTSALYYGKLFFNIYFDHQSSSNLLIVDIGAQDINGSLKQFSPLESNYVGVDFVEGAGVDVVLTDPYALPFETGTVDAVVCSSVYEHSEFFWLLFLESLRILKPSGLLYLNAPSNGKLHRYPIDAWRFYPDAAKSLTNWARHNGMYAVLLESFIGAKIGDPMGEGMWNDFVAVIARDEKYISAHSKRMMDVDSSFRMAYAHGYEESSPPDGLMPYQLAMNLQENEMAQILSDKEVLRKDIQIVQAEKESLDHELYAMRQSKSWRITAPLRLIGGLLKERRIASMKEVSNDHIQPTTSSVDACSNLMQPSASFEVLSGLAPKSQTSELKQDASTLIAFYLPQYHKVAENSEWWGPGFTEWTNVVKGKPNYEGHYQPHLPRELGFYDLANVEVMREQAELAKLYGVGAFCFYYYWFSGRRILEKPIDNFLNSDIDMPYCLCWANENWTRTWDGDTRSILLEQKYLESDPQEFIESLLPHFRDTRYLKVDGKPMLVVYRAKDIPNVSRVFQLWRDAVKSAGFPDLHIAAVDFYDIARPDEVGADALVEFPPHKFNGPNSVPDRVPNINNNEFRGSMVDCAKVMAQSANRPVPDFTLYRGVLPSWDNTARRQNTPTILHGSTPELFKQWLSYVRSYTRVNMSGRSDNFIFINAWNEWGEGCHLEPDQKYGLQYLEAVKSSSWYEESSAGVDNARQTLIAKAVDSIKVRNASHGQTTCTETIQQALESNKTTHGRAQRIAYRLRNYPIAFFIGKYIYKTYCFIWRQ